ncbi:MAG TPA: hypothetical protein VI540_07945 [Gaiellaceae bacterium]|nr:hypothetical protein [Gaiellaceae bacterium]
MRLLTVLGCALLAAIVVASAAASPSQRTGGVLSVERGKGSVLLEIRGAVLGRLASGLVRVTDTTPRDRFEPLVAGRRVTEEQISPTTTVYRGFGLRFRVVGGGSRILVRGSGISISAVGRGFVVLHGERKAQDDDAGVYSLEGVDCQLETATCLPLPDVPTRVVLAPPDTGELRVR